MSLIKQFEEETEKNVYYANLSSGKMLQNTLPNTVKVEVEFRF